MRGEGKSDSLFSREKKLEAVIDATEFRDLEQVADAIEYLYHSFSSLLFFPLLSSTLSSFLVSVDFKKDTKERMWGR